MSIENRTSRKSSRPMQVSSGLQQFIIFSLMQSNIHHFKCKDHHFSISNSHLGVEEGRILVRREFIHHFNTKLIILNTKFITFNAKTHTPGETRPAPRSEAV